MENSLQELTLDELEVVSGGDACQGFAAGAAIAGTLSGFAAAFAPPAVPALVIASGLLALGAAITCS